MSNPSNGTTDPGSETEARDERRGQIIGECWLLDWIEEGRTTGEKGCASWINSCRETEKREYEWIWVPPYLQNEAGGELDRYRGQRAGAVIVKSLAQTVQLSGGHWFDRAAKHAESTDEQWLFLAGMIEIDGWRQVTLQDGAIVWTKESPTTT